ncbi:ISP domain-containing protein [Calocera viscosa TUFC12733]|uniref:Choline monooxygenase, chloroplastic n=1 Tax=Calocera viscosa (strain TUFC12733) TaxID=1330018 RepID=A0A167RN52_CALVF|nr:ISP domain-containing protein [Calocera viscosa TUFC12733]
MATRLLHCGRNRGTPLLRVNVIGWRRQLATISPSSVRSPKKPLSHELEAAARPDRTGVTTLPASWYRSDNFKLSQLEKRAIFARSWFFTTVTSEFKKKGDYRVFDFAGLSMFLVKGHDGEIRAFHNVCRHRAYPLRTQEAGCSGVISCGYHAWTFDLNGNLMKAPHFNDVDKKANGLYPVHLHITPGGLIFVNLEASETPSVSFEEYFPGLETLLDGFDLKRYELYKAREFIGDFNWKTRIDGFQECYHCHVAHKSLSKSFDIKNYAVRNHPNYTQHIALASPSSAKDAYGNSDALFLYLYPSGAINCFKNGWQRSFSSPIDSGRTRISMEYYVDPDLSEQEKADFVQSFYQVFEEDCALCTNTQRSLDAGVYAKGVLHPVHESGVIVQAYQSRTKELVLKHAALEESLGRELNPASRADQNSFAQSPEDSLCARLEQREW